MSRYKSILFDLDGTLIDSSLDIKNSLKLAFQENNFHADLIDQVNVGPPLEEYIIQVTSTKLSKGSIQFISESFKKSYDQCDYLNTKVYDGLLEVLDHLKQSKFQLFIATFKRTYPTHRLLKMKNLLSYFEGVGCIDSRSWSHLGKQEMIAFLCEEYRLKKISTLMIGDMTSDLIAAKQVGIDSVGVLYGYGQSSDIFAVQPTYVISKPVDILKFVLS